jgi:hypothetical protein
MLWFFAIVIAFLIAVKWHKDGIDYTDEEIHRHRHSD